MNRRTLLIAGGGTAAAVSGGATVANASRADLLANSELTRGKGEAVAIEKTITRDSVEYLDSINKVRENGHTEPFHEWARRESAAIGASETVSIVENRVGESVKGVGSGVRYLIFGPAITVDHTVTHDRNGTIVSKPNVPLDQLTSVAPRTMTVTVNLNGQGHMKELPVAVGHSVVSMD